MDKYALLTTEKYAELNAEISNAAGFATGESTERYTTETPELDSNGMSVMIITGRVQERFPESLIDVELVDNYEIPNSDKNMQV